MLTLITPQNFKLFTLTRKKITNIKRSYEPELSRSFFRETPQKTSSKLGKHNGMAAC